MTICYGTIDPSDFMKMKSLDKFLIKLIFGVCSCPWLTLKPKKEIPYLGFSDLNLLLESLFWHLHGPITVVSKHFTSTN